MYFFSFSLFFFFLYIIVASIQLYSDSNCSYSGQFHVSLASKLTLLPQAHTMCLLMFHHKVFFETMKTCSSHKLGTMWNLISSGTILSINECQWQWVNSCVSPFARTDMGTYFSIMQQMKLLASTVVTLSLINCIAFLPYLFSRITL